MSETRRYCDGHAPIPTCLNCLRPVSKSAGCKNSPPTCKFRTALDTSPIVPIVIPPAEKWRPSDE